MFGLKILIDTKHHGTKFFSYYCLQHFSSEEILSEHKEVCRKTISLYLLIIFISSYKLHLLFMLILNVSQFQQM